MVAATPTGLRMSQKALGLSDAGMCEIIGVTMPFWRAMKSDHDPVMPGEEVVRRIELAEDLKQMKERM